MLRDISVAIFGKHNLPQAKYPSTGEWINLAWYSHYYGILYSNEDDKQQLYVIMWMNFTNIMLSKRNHMKEYILFNFSYKF